MMQDLELEKAIKEIKRTAAKRVLIQVPEGLKPKATEIVSELEQETEAEVFIWAGSCYGACDIPPDLKDVGLLIQFGHSPWPFWKDNPKITAEYNLENS